MVFQQKLLEKAYFIVKMTGPAIIQPASSVFWKHIHKLTKISIVPLAIFVGIAKAWKKEVFSGPSPVLPLGTNTSIGARAPALAGAATLFARIRSRTSTRSSLVNTKPTLPLMWGISLQGNSTQSKNNNNNRIPYYRTLMLHEIIINVNFWALISVNVNFCAVN